jgi:signal transduction histidine kinase
MAAALPTGHPFDSENLDALGDQALERVQWIDSQLATRFLSHIRGTLVMGPVALLISGGLLWAYRPSAGVVIWLVIGLVLAGMRAWVVLNYHRHVAKRDVVQRLVYMAKLRWSWPLVPFHWGCMCFLFYDKVPLSVDFMLISVLVGVGTTAIYSFSSDLWVLRRYLLALLVPSLLAILVQAVTPHETARSLLEHLVVMALGLLYFWSCMHSAVRMHNFQRETLALQFDNERLIQSLDQRTRQAADAMSSRSRLLAGAAHDLRQPVHALSLYADWLRGEPELVQELTPKIIESTAAVNRLFDGLFALAQLDQNTGSFKLQPVDIAGLLSSLHAQYGAQAQSRGLVLRHRQPNGRNTGSTTGTNTGFAYTDATAIRRVVGNLLDNAIKYTESGGVLISARLRGEHWHVEVWDTGVGIAPAHQQAIFSEFFRVPSHEGTQDSFGLGLSIVQKLARAIGAEVSLRSRLGKGSCFSVKLLACDGSAQPTTVTHSHHVHEPPGSLMLPA